MNTVEKDDQEPDLFDLSPGPTPEQLDLFEEDATASQQITAAPAHDRPAPITG